VSTWYAFSVTLVRPGVSDVIAVASPVAAVIPANAHSIIE